MKNSFFRAVALIFVLALVVSLASSLGAKPPCVREIASGTQFSSSPRTAMTINSTLKWARIFGNFFAGAAGKEFSNGLCIVPTGDGGIVVGGVADLAPSSPDPDDRMDALVMEVRPSGMVVWEVLFESDPAKECDNWIQDLIRTRDGGYLAVGSVSKRIDLSHRALAMKLDHGGGVQWMKSYAQSDHVLFAADTVIELRDGEYLVVSGTGAGGVLFFGLDSSGNIVWFKNLAISISSVKATADGGFVAAGSSDDGQAQLLKFDGTGDIVWRRSYQNDPVWNCGDYISWAYLVCPTADGGYALAGSTFGCYMDKAVCWVCTLDQTGQIIRHKGFDFVYPRVLLPTKDGGFLVGDIQRMLKLSPALEVQWQRGYPDIYIYSAFQADDGGFLLSGYMQRLEDTGGRVTMLCLDRKGMIGTSCPWVIDSNIAERESIVSIITSPPIQTLRTSLTARTLKYYAYPRTCDVETLCVFGQMPPRRPVSGRHPER